MEVYSKVAGKRRLAVGDAAFAPDPLSGMGIEFAVESSILAARVVQAISESCAMRFYKNWVNDYFRQHYQTLRFLKTDQHFSDWAQ